MNKADSDVVSVIGLSFLNVGSGTGYLSTLVGLIIGRKGINHGVDVYEDAIDYANKNVTKFIKYGEAFDHNEFCKPFFVRANGLCLDSNFRLYDRVYCGARIPDEKCLENIKRLVKPHGILIYPYNESVSIQPFYLFISLSHFGFMEVGFLT